MKTKKREKGQSLLEFAMMLPVLLIILGGLLDLGRLYFAYVAVTDAAGEGATYAAIFPTDETGILQRAQSATGGLVVLDVDSVETISQTVASGAPITVSVRYNHSLATPLINAIVPGGTLLLRAVATEAILAY